MSANLANLANLSHLRPIPFKTFLTIYNKAHHTCTINYNTGTKALISYLTSDNRIPFSITPMHPIMPPRYLQSYDLNELAKALSNCPINSIEATNWIKIIYTYTIQAELSHERTL